MYMYMYMYVPKVKLHIQYYDSYRKIKPILIAGIFFNVAATCTCMDTCKSYHRY